MLRLIAVLLAGVSVACGRSADRPVTIFAAASLTDALEAALEGCPEPVRVSAAATSVLARQIEAGAPADVFLSANKAWMDRLEADGHLRPGTRGVMFGNSLVLVVPAGAGGSGLDGTGRVAIADPAHVPAGIYAEQALRYEGLWTSLEGRLVYAADVRAVVAFVVRGEVAAGVVYSTDARAAAGLRVVRTFPEASHDPIRYHAAAVAGARPEAEAILDWLRGERARAAFAAAGFRTGEGP